MNNKQKLDDYINNDVKNLGLDSRTQTLVQNDGEWIPVSERLPDDREWYLAIFQETDTGWVNPLPFICDYLGKVTKFTTQDGWIIRDCTDVDIPHEYYTKLLKCVAWHPLPEPYKEADNDIR